MSKRVNVLANKVLVDEGRLIDDCVVYAKANRTSVSRILVENRMCDSTINNMHGSFNKYVKKGIIDLDTFNSIYIMPRRPGATEYCRLAEVCRIFELEIDDYLVKERPVVTLESSDEIPEEEIKPADKFDRMIELLEENNRLLKDQIKLLKRPTIN